MLKNSSGVVQRGVFCMCVVTGGAVATWLHYHHHPAAAVADASTQAMVGLTDASERLDRVIAEAETLHAKDLERIREMDAEAQRRREEYAQHIKWLQMENAEELQKAHTTEDAQRVERERLTHLLQATTAESQALEQRCQVLFGQVNSMQGEREQALLAARTAAAEGQRIRQLWEEQRAELRALETAHASELERVKASMQARLAQQRGATVRTENDAETRLERQQQVWLQEKERLENEVRRLSAREDSYAAESPLRKQRSGR